MHLAHGGMASTALDLLSILQPSKRSAATPPPAGTDDRSNAFASQIARSGATDAASSGSGAGSSLLNANVLGFLIHNQGQQSADTAAAGTPPLSPGQSRLFAKLDADGDGGISKSEFQSALGANGNTQAADKAFASIDGNDDGSIDPAELAAARPARRHRHHMMGNNQASGAPGADSAQDGGLAKLLATLGTSSQATNPDGSTTTTITYQDGSKVTLTTPVQQASGATTSATTGQSGGRSAGHTANPLETLIQLQAQLFAAPAVGGKAA